MKNETKTSMIKTKFTDEEIKRIQEDFISQMRVKTELSEEELKAICEKYLGRDFWNN
tara:strand:- start:687 stop:857 length:171 start_codon:yes stop_codon:yes gene_type:complete